MSLKVSLSKAEAIPALLKEYELCQSSAYALEHVIWQTSAVLGLGSIGALAAVAAQRPMILVSALIACLSTSSSFLWWKVAKRWWVIQHVKFARMRHIESEIPAIRQNSYVKYLDDLHDTLRDERLKPSPREPDQIKNTLRRELGITPKYAEDLERLEYQRAGPKEILACLPLIILLAWASYLLLDAARLVVEALCLGA